MNIHIDTSPMSTGHKHRGIGVYTSKLIKALKDLDDKSAFFVEDKKNADIVHYPYFDFFFHTLPIIRRKKTIVTIHDVIPLIFPDEYSPGIKGSIKFGLQKKAIKSIQAIITDSVCSKKDIHEYLNISKEKIHTIYLASPIGKSEKPTNKNPIKEKYILYVGDINYNKNLPALLHAFSTSIHQSHHLVIVSRAMKNTHIKEAESIISTIKKLNIKDKVKIITDASNDDLRSLYASADWYVQPSLYEGFGLPILEAFTSEIPVVCAQAGSLPEVAGDAAVYFNPKDISDISNALDKVVNQSDRERSQRIQKGKDQLKKFSWEKTARDTLRVYKKVFESK